MSKKEKWRTCPRKQQNRLHRGFSRHSSRASFTAASVVVRHYFELHKPFCSAECKFNLTGQPNYPVVRLPKRGRRSDERKHFYFHAHGVTYGNRQAAISCCTRGEQIQLVREPQNPYDKYAIRICRLSSQVLGYVPRECAAELAPKMTTDFRQVIGEAVSRHLGNQNLAQVFPGYDNQPAKFLKFLSVT